MTSVCWSWRSLVSFCPIIYWDGSNLPWTPLSIALETIDNSYHPNFDPISSLPFPIVGLGKLPSALRVQQEETARLNLGIITPINLSPKTKPNLSLQKPSYWLWHDWLGLSLIWQDTHELSTLTRKRENSTCAGQICLQIIILAYTIWYIPPSLLTCCIKMRLSVIITQLIRAKYLCICNLLQGLLHSLPITR